MSMRAKPRTKVNLNSQGNRRWYKHSVTCGTHTALQHPLPVCPEHGTLIVGDSAFCKWVTVSIPFMYKEVTKEPA